MREISMVVDDIVVFKQINLMKGNPEETILDGLSQITHGGLMPNSTT